MKTWQWMTATAISAVVMATGVISFADSYITAKINDKVEVLREMIAGVKEKVDSIDKNVDRLLGNKHTK